MHRFIAPLLGFILFACSPADDADPTTAARERGPDGPLLVYTVNYPLLYLAERIGGDRVEAHFPAPADSDPAMWSPGAELIGEYQQADLILLNGAGFAGWVERSMLPRARLVDTSVAFQDRLIPLAESITHSHGPEGEHSHAGWAVETWLDPTLAIEQARVIAEVFSRELPAHADAFAAGLAGLEADLASVDSELQAAADQLGDRALAFSHPAYAYLEARYGLNGISVHWPSDAVPGHYRLVELEEKLAEHPAEWMIWEAAPPPEAVEVLRDRGLSSTVFATGSHRPAEGDYLDIMRKNAAALAAID
jgi:zinc transport system substrate-binding protein